MNIQKIYKSFKRFFDDEMSERREFYSFLKGEFISEKNNLHAVSLWNEFEMKTMDDYHDLYQLIGVCLEYYGLDPCHYFSSPGLSIASR